jgi:hypothetical protein
MQYLMENGGDLTQAGTNFGSGAGVKLPFVYLSLKLIDRTPC